MHPTPYGVRIAKTYRRNHVRAVYDSLPGKWAVGGGGEREDRRSPGQRVSVAAGKGNDRSVPVRAIPEQAVLRRHAQAMRFSGKQCGKWPVVTQDKQRIPL